MVFIKIFLFVAFIAAVSAQFEIPSFPGAELFPKIPGLSGAEAPGTEAPDAEAPGTEGAEGNEEAAGRYADDINGDGEEMIKTKPSQIHY